MLLNVVLSIVLLATPSLIFAIAVPVSTPDLGPRAASQKRSPPSQDPKIELAYQTMKLRGEELYQALKCREYQPKPLFNRAQLAIGGWLFNDDLDVASAPASSRTLLINEGLPTSKAYSWIRAYRGSGTAQSSFANLYRPASGAIIAEQNSRRAGPGVLHWSDVVAALWVERCEAEGRDPTKLTKVFRAGVENQLTLAVRERMSGPVQAGPTVVVRPDDSTAEDFFAFLGSPNGMGVAWLLLQHDQHLGQRIVTNISTLVEKIGPFFEFNMWLGIDDAPEVDPSECCD